MNWSTIMGIASTLAFLAPVVIILVFKLYRHHSLLALSIYYALSVFYNLVSQKIIVTSAHFETVFGTLNNYLDAPLMIIFLMFFCNGRCNMKNFYALLGAVVIYNMIIGITNGFTFESNIYILGPGIAVILISSLILFMPLIKSAIVHGKGIGKTLMLASVIFSYGCFGLIYIFHYIQQSNAENDIFLLFFFTSLIACTLMSVGLMYIHRHLKKLEEVKTTRKELQVFFNN